MINSINASYAETNGKEHAFQLAANANIYEILTSKIYTNPIEAVVRELISNAIDSGGRVFVTIPTSQYAANFVVEDSGCGMTAEEVDNIYATYGVSNKTNSNDKIGGLGIGAKSPLAYTSQFELLTGKNGIKHTYLIHMSSEGIPCKIDAGEEPSDWTGTKVTVSVKDDDCEKFQKAILKVCLFTEKEVKFIINEKNVENFLGEIGLHTLDQYENLRNVVKNESIIKTINDIFVNENISGYSLSDFFKSEIGTVCVNMGGVCYKVDINKTFADYDKYRDIKNLITSNLIIILNSPIGSLSFQASREELNYTDDTIGKIRKLILNVLEKELEKNFDEKTNSLQDLAFNIRSIGHALNTLSNLNDSTAISLKESINIKFNKIKTDIDAALTNSENKRRSVFIGDWQNVGIYKYITHLTYNPTTDSRDSFLYMLTNIKRIITYNSDVNFNDSNVFTSSQIKIISKSNLKDFVVSTHFILIPEETLATFKKYITNVTEEKYEDLQSDYKAKMKLCRSTKIKAGKITDPIFVCSLMNSTKSENHLLSELIKMPQPKVLCVTNAKLKGHGYNIPKYVQSVQVINAEKWWNKTNSKINTYNISNFMSGFKCFVEKGLVEELPIFVYATLGEFRDVKVQKMDNFFSIDTYLKEFVNINALDKIEPLIQASFDMSLRSVEFIARCIESDKDSHFYTDSISSSSLIINMINLYKEDFINVEKISTMSYFIDYIKTYIYQLVDEKTQTIITEKLNRLQSKTVSVKILDKYPMLQAAADAWKYSSAATYQKVVCDYINLVDRSGANK